MDTRYPSLGESTRTLLQSGRSLLALSQGVMKIGAEQAAAFFDRSLALADNLGAFRGASRGDACGLDAACDCRTGLRVVRDAIEGEVLVEPVLVRNNAKRTLQFSCRTEPMAGTGNAKGPDLAVDGPDQLSLEPGTTGVFRLRIAVADIPPGRFEGTVRITGACEHLITVIVQVRDKNFGSVAVTQDDCPPYRVHRWQDHFYCAPATPRVHVRKAT